MQKANIPKSAFQQWLYKIYQGASRQDRSAGPAARYFVYLVYHIPIFCWGVLYSHVWKVAFWNELFIAFMVGLWIFTRHTELWFFQASVCHRLRRRGCVMGCWTYMYTFMYIYIYIYIYIIYIHVYVQRSIDVYTRYTYVERERERKIVYLQAATSATELLEPDVWTIQ